jgi:hypothetical protein
MFKILTLTTGVDDQLQSIQNNYEIDAVEVLGHDAQQNQYISVQYSTAAPGTTNTSGSAVLTAKKDDKAAPAAAPAKKAGK